MANSDACAPLVGAGAGEWRLGHYLPSYLTGPERVDVDVALNINQANSDLAGGLRLQVVWKFRYPTKAIEYFGEEIPTQLPFSIRRTGTECRRWLPMTVEGFYDEQDITWSVTINEKGEVYERLQQYATVNLQHYNNYFPFTTKILAIKLILDGTGRTAHVNLIPRLKKSEGKYCTETGDYKVDSEFGAFLKTTSAASAKNSDSMLGAMMVREQNATGTTGTFTRVYYTLVFPQDWGQPFLKYIVVSCLLMCFVPWLGGSAGLDDTIANGAVIISAIILLLFTLHDDHSSTTRDILTIHLLTCSGQIFTILHGIYDTRTEDCPNYKDSCPSNFLRVVNLVVIVLTLAMVAYAYFKNFMLGKNIREAFKFPSNYHLCNFNELEKVL